MTQPLDAQGPGRYLNAFVCPQCHAYSQQTWFNAWMIERSDTNVEFKHEELAIARCERCGRFSTWLGDRMLDPVGGVGPIPHEDMPEDVRAVYEEARSVGTLSRKSAAALLRLALQVLIDELEPGRGRIDDKIGRLVSGGLDPQVQQAMDVVRVVGNNAVHPGQIDLDGDAELVPSLFALVNLIVEQMISRPKRIQALFSALPEGARQAIERRDGKS